MASAEIFRPPQIESALPIAPAPWSLKATLWAFVCSPSTSTSSAAPPSTNKNNDPETLQGAPAGSYHPLEIPHVSALTTVRDAFQLSGGPCAIMIVRYTDTPVGPYDELIFSPGTYATPGKGAGKAPRITNIYVSSDASVFNGRHNWNIPKHRADFVFERLDARRTAVRVSHPPGSSLYTGKPFFRAVLTASRLPSLPLPAVTPRAIVQPPLATPRPGAGLAVISTDATHPWGDGVGFPELKGLWSLGGILAGDTPLLPVL